MFARMRCINVIKTDYGRLLGFVFYVIRMFVELFTAISKFCQCVSMDMTVVFYIEFSRFPPNLVMIGPIVKKF